MFEPVTISQSEQAAVPADNPQFLWCYVYLQLLDLLTTAAFLAHRVEEANPIVRLSMGTAAGTMPGLLLIKTMAVLLGLFCWRTGRVRMLSMANRFYAVLVVWN